jgi:hypothetical protein
MLRLLFLLLAIASLAFSATTPAVPRKCGSEVSPTIAAKIESQFAKHNAAADVAAAANSSTNAQRVAPVIPVYFHVIRKDSTIAGGNIPYVTVSYREYLVNVVVL